MDAHTLRVVSGTVSCEASCPHCAYHRGKKPQRQNEFDFQTFKKARQFAVQSGAVAMEIDAQGNPLLDEWTKLYQILSEGSADFPQVGLTTPGSGILESRDSFLNLVGWHLTNLTLTIPHHQPRKRKALLGLTIDYKPLIAYLKEECHVVIRAACFLSKPGISSPQEALDFVHWCREMGIPQIVFKEIGTPDENLDQKATQWCLENAIELDFDENWNFDDPANRVFYINSLVAQNRAHPVFVFPWGEPAYDIDGVNVVFEKSESNYYGTSIKSLVLSGNHLYARWESDGTIIF
jgi:hypothetical protein